jgi:hypothetical protein
MYIPLLEAKGYRAVLNIFVYSRLYIQPSILIHQVYVKYYSTVFSEAQELLRLLLVVFIN